MYAGHFDFSVPVLGRVPAIYSPAECAAILDGVRDAEWLAGTVNRASGREVDTRVRDNLIAIVRDSAVGALLWTRIAGHLPATMSTAWDGPRRTVAAHGLFEPLRVYRYDVGHHDHQTIAPRAGDALWFQHAVLHAGKQVTRGTKHVLRTDVLYR